MKLRLTWGTQVSMAVIVIGGQASGVGKTGVVCSLIAGMRERRWTAIKISQLEVGETGGDGIAIFEERSAGRATDSARYLAAGAVRSFWVRTRRGRLEEAMPRVRELMAGAGDVIVESNSVLGFLRPDFYGVVLDPRVADFKASALRYLERADALLVVGSGLEGANWAGVSRDLVEGIPQFRVGPPGYGSVEFSEYVAEVLHKSGK